MFELPYRREKTHAVAAGDFPSVLVGHDPAFHHVSFCPCAFTMELEALASEVNRSSDFPEDD